jgi:superfamily II DNA or RNA helicase
MKKAGSMKKPTLRDYQERAILQLRDCVVNGLKKVIMVLPTGGGKCLGKGTNVLLYSGETKKAEHVRVGDRLMGPDSLPRTVLSTCSGFGPMIKVTPTKGDSYCVTPNHILSLKQTKTDNDPKFPSENKGGSIVNIPACDFINKSKWFKRIHKSYRVGVEFNDTDRKLKLAPYFLGVWLGDGSSSGPQITTEDSEIIEYIRAYCVSLGIDCEITQKKRATVTLGLYTKLRKRSPKHSNIIMEGLRYYNLIKNKHIPIEYKYGSRRVRLDVIAGIIDTDGHYDGKGGYSVIQKNEVLLDDFVFIARSLGLAAYKVKTIKKCCNNGVVGSYYKAGISGNINKIPCKIKRKIAPERRQKKDVLVSGIKVEWCKNQAEWYGFEVEGDHLFLLGDFTVTHNSVIFGKIIENALDKEKTVLWLVHRRNLVYQMRDVLAQFGIDCGIIMAGNESNTKLPIQLCTVQTLSRRLKLADPFSNHFYIDADLVLIDEGHRSMSKTYLDLIELYRDKIIISCTATPIRADGMGMGKVYEAIVDVAGVQELIDQKYLSPVRYFAAKSPNLKDVKIARGDYVVKDLDKKMNKTKLNGDIVENWLKFGENRQTIVFCVNVKHSIAVCEEFNRHGISAEHLDARSDDDTRDDVFRRMEDGDTKVICNVGLYQEGLDVPEVSCIVMARPTKSMGLYRQCCGRGLRISQGKEDCLDSETLILTDKGSIKIKDITLDNRIWDGVSFVNHSGAICKGVQKTITYRGLTATLNHEVMTNEGWKTFQEAAYRRLRIVKTGAGGKEIRFSANNFKGNRGEVGPIKSSCTMFKMWEGLYAYVSQYAEKAINKSLPVLQPLYANGCSKMGLSKNPSSKRPMRKRKKQTLSGLWRPWNKIQIQNCAYCNHLDKKQFRNTCIKKVTTGQNKQRWTLRTREPEMDVSCNEHEQFKKNKRGEQAEVCKFQKAISIYKICGQHITSFYSRWINRRRNCFKMGNTLRQTEREVWDIHNAGLLQRFTANGFLVHNCLVFDHGGVIEEHGFLEDEIEWSLYGKDVAWKKKKKSVSIPKPCKCRVCNEIFVGLKVCPRCGTELKSFGKKIETVDGVLVELKAVQKRNRDYTWEDKRRLMGALKWHVERKGYRNGWAAHAYKDFFGVWPNDKRVRYVSPIEPTGNIKNLLTHILIKKAKAYQKQQNTREYG